MTLPMLIVAAASSVIALATLFAVALARAGAHADRDSDKLFAVRNRPAPVKMAAGRLPSPFS